MSLRNDLLREILDHCTHASFEECCGLLIGRRVGDEVIVEKIKKAKNIYPYDKRVGYIVDPLDYLEAEKEAEKNRLEVLGVYHSHIWIGPSPSMRDWEQAIPGYIYLIISLNPEISYKAWIMEKDGKRFKEVEIKII
ncbi:MAG: M67 family metallopeptidase [Aigarchaeota archaeon]|nr:M67 family metallopeptidase [Aigarchaeota archaeon]MCX8192424.1 M67 family metallopeptidase [Nitrososphaeria archaeon]MDW7986630.1 M67 family metallopeptidase [Nitrososphaerota archaeon]